MEASEQGRDAWVRAGLGAPAFVHGRAALYLGDALELLRALPDGSVPLVLTSPPYNIGKPYEQVRPLEQYLDWCRRWLGELYRVCAPEGALWLNLGYTEAPGRGKAVPLPYLLWPELGFYLVQEVVWHYRAGVACRRRFSPRNEKLLWLVKDPRGYLFDLDAVRDPDVRYPDQRRGGRLRCNPAGKNPTDVWTIPKVTSGRGRSSPERVAHPAQMPLAVAERVVKACSRPGELVLDPFCGSGTTAVAALREGRSAVGFELDSRYLELAGRRIANLA